MSAHRDKSQKIAFVYSNLYQIYRQGKKAAELAPGLAPDALAGLPPQAEPRPLTHALLPPAFRHSPQSPLPVASAASTRASSSHVSPKLASLEALRQAASAEPALLAPVAIIRDPVASVKISPHSPPEFLAKRLPPPSSGRADPAVQSLKDNLKTLNDLHSRLRFMLRELEDLIKE